MKYYEWMITVIALIVESDHLSDSFKVTEIKKALDHEAWYKELYESKTPNQCLQLLVESYIEEYGDTEDR